MAWLAIIAVGVLAAIALSPIFAVIFLVVLITGIVALTRGSRTWLRFSSRRTAAWVTAFSAVGFLVTGSMANLVIGGDRGEETVAAVVEPTTVPSEPVDAPTPTPSETPTPTPTPTVQAVAVTNVIDGDTITTTAGDVRLIGIDTPERGQWGYDDARTELEGFLSAGVVTLVAVDGRDDVDRYDRLLRYVRVDGNDAGAHMIGTGWAIAKYDGRDGYGSHPLQDDYIASDAKHEMPAEPAPEPEPAPAEPETDPRFGTCGEANDNGYSDYQEGVDPEYHWYQDRDGDGWVCER
ncbi:thermonuclease family protein [Microbacterium dauci]|uniref:Thermonuclease family protein n=1 Tax=Microbacterium dauci TaxID=3048008 RepID=A0ABT6ZCB9_9MICO|nr:thermonuclease family protein [Microbacterium sp. LX3-4]MDJ1113798.1 thermonuclease family protein [Microbacterium sp. LX3-4]